MADTDYGSIFGGLGALTSVGGGIFSSISQSEDASKVASIQKNIVGLEMQAEKQRKTAMELNARRQMMEQVRIGQRARAMSLNTATNQGAQFSSALGGAYGGIAGQISTNQLGVEQNLSIGENLFSINNSIDQQKIAMADAKSQEASDEAFGSLFKGIGSSAPALGKLGMSIAPMIFGV